MCRRPNGAGRCLVLGLLVVLGGCGGNVSVSRGFGSREVQPLRDPTLQLDYLIDVQGQDPTLVYTTIASPEAVSLTYWSLDLVTGALQNDGPNPPSSGAPPPPISARYTCVTNDLMPDGSETVEITDTTIGATTDIDGVTAFPACAADDGTIALFRLDPDTGKQVLATGPYQNLTTVTLPFDILSVVFFRGNAGGSTEAVVVGAASGQPSAAGIYSIDLTSGATTELVPATPASAGWGTGAPQAGSLQSTSVSPAVQVLQYHGHYIYGRTMSDGGTTLFVGPFTSGPASELALFQLSASGGMPALPPGVRVGLPDDYEGPVVVPRVFGWQVDGGNGVPSQLIVWDDTTQEVTLCPSSPGAFESGVSSIDGTHVLFKALQLGGQLAVAPLQLMNLAAGQPHTCAALQDGNVMWADFSGDGSMIAWLVATNGALDGELWTANSDGTNPRMILSGQMLSARFIDGTSHLEMSYSGDLVWLDVTDPKHFAYVAEQLFGQAAGIGGSWFVAGYDYSPQDASGLLGTVNLDSGKKVQISAAVTQYLVAAQSAPVDGGVAGPETTGVYHVAYVVRGRNPSAQDGIWVATVQAADLQ